MNNEAFLALVRAGLWEDFESVSGEGLAVSGTDVLRLAEEQSVVGLVAAGAEWFTVNGSRCMIPLTEKLTLLGRCQLIEQRNEAMNRFIAELVGQLNKKGIDALLVKGQGVAQCYERPLWRSAGDIDFLLDEENYNKAKAFLSAFAEKAVAEDVGKKHLSVQIKGFPIELHGRMPFALSRRADRVIDEVVADTLLKLGDERLAVRVWKNGDTEVYLPNADNDVVLVFTHFLHHFFIEGVGLKQICDWCRLLWTYRDEIDRPLLESRLRSMGLMSEWKAFASLAVNCLGMPEAAMPFYDKRYRRIGETVLSHVLKSGNLGHNNNQRYRSELSKPLANIITFFRRIGDFTKFAFIFPIDSSKFFITYLFGKFKKNSV